MTRWIVFVCALALTASAAEAATTTDTKSTIDQYVGQASIAYLKHDYPQAIRLYTAALDIHRKAPALDRDRWRMVVDNLGMSYGISGDNQSAKKIFEYGISVEPDYPMFHYNRACALAELGDPGGALAELKAAFANKHNMIAGERMPDPRTDSSFRRYMRDENFRRVVNDLLAAK